MKKLQLPESEKVQLKDEELAIVDREAIEVRKKCFSLCALEDDFSRCIAGWFGNIILYIICLTKFIQTYLLPCHTVPNHSIRIYDSLYNAIHYYIV